MAEHTLYGKRKLCYTEVTDFTDFQGIGRDPLYKRFDSVYAVIERHIAPEYRDFLAHPIYSDEDQILWYVREWHGTPSQYNELSDAERVRYDAIKQKTIEVYEKVRKELSGEDKQILTGALRFIDEDFMFCYDDKVVLVAWGMVPDTNKHIVKGAVMHDLKIQSSHKIKFMVGEHGTLKDRLSGVVSRPDGSTLSFIDIPEVTPNRGYAFKCWEPNPIGVKVTSALTFVAQYDAVDVEEEVVVERANVTFVAEEGGVLDGECSIKVDKGLCIDPMLIPRVVPNPGYSFVGWNIEPYGAINEDVTFRAEFKRDDVTCRFIAGDEGVLNGNSIVTLPYGTVLTSEHVPTVEPKRAYEFLGWDRTPVGMELTGEECFKAQYKKIPWYKRFWRWLTRNGCLWWLLWILLAILLTWLCIYLFDGCERRRSVSKPDVIELPKKETTDGDIIDDNGPIKGIVDDKGNLPDEVIVAPIVGDDGEEPPIITNPGAPDIIANRLNVYFERADVNLDQFVKDMKRFYDEEQCKAIGVDRHVPMIQLLIDESLRDKIREKLPQQLSGYEFFIVDEAIFSLVGSHSSDVVSAGWHLDAIDVEEGWKITKGDPNLIVAVVDDGIDATHEILKGRIVKPYNVFTKDNRLSTGSGHGTHVAGLAVGSDIKFDEGVSGVAPNCKLMPVQVFDNEYCTFSSLTSGIMYAIHNGASVVNVSVGPNFNGLDMLPDSQQRGIADTMFKNEEAVWRRIINVANEHNVIIVFAVGNNHILATIPPENRTNYTINVAAVDSNIRETDFTNHGEGSNISAPGQGILSSVPRSDYAVFDGTSMAAPIVAGTVALMRSCDPDITVTEVLNILQRTGELVSSRIPPMVQVDDALIALTTGVFPDRSKDVDNVDVTPGSGGSTPGTGGGTAPGNGGDVVPGNGGGGSAPGSGTVVTPGNGTTIPVDPGAGDDYERIRRLIEEYKRKIAELEKLLPENK